MIIPLDAAGNMKIFADYDDDSDHESDIGLDDYE